ncbi:MAG: 5-formyltetrahydrofolate cyclo-ligase [Alphaproteobacteria bacterium]|nr:5-formyltetrahydrofolate cyclo-ligase [Alphaproteobacteria bacterium]
MNLPDIANAKRKLRAEALARRKNIASQSDGSEHKKLCDNFFKHELNAKISTVSGYIPMKSEISPLLLMEKLSQEGCALCVPAVVDKKKPMLFKRWDSDTELKKCPFGADYPAKTDEVIPDLLLIPLLAFDRNGYRLGYGGGCFDRTLEHLKKSGNPISVGVAYSCQEVDEVPHADFDSRLDWIVTELEVIKIEKKNR